MSEQTKQMITIYEFVVDLGEGDHEESFVLASGYVDLSSECEKNEQRIGFLTLSLAEAERQIAELRGFIERWCNHDRQCKLLVHAALYPCDCGFREAIDKALSGGG